MGNPLRRGEPEPARRFLGHFMNDAGEDVFPFNHFLAAIDQLVQVRIVMNPSHSLVARPGFNGPWSARSINWMIFPGRRWRAAFFPSDIRSALT